MKIKIVKGTTEQEFESNVNAAILALQQAGNSEFTLQYQPVWCSTVGSNGSGGGSGSYGYVIYTVFITYK